MAAGERAPRAERAVPERRERGSGVVAGQLEPERQQQHPAQRAPRARCPAPAGHAASRRLLAEQHRADRPAVGPQPAPRRSRPRPRPAPGLRARAPRRGRWNRPARRRRPPPRRAAARGRRAAAWTSSPRVGFSATRTRGRRSSARATRSFCWLPPLRLPAGAVRARRRERRTGRAAPWCAAAARQSTRRTRRPTIQGAARPRRAPRSRSGSADGISPSVVRSSGMKATGRDTSSSPRNGRRRPATARSNSRCPFPSTPATATSSPPGRSNDAWRSAGAGLPRHLERLAADQHRPVSSASRRAARRSRRRRSSPPSAPPP